MLHRAKITHEPTEQNSAGYLDSWNAVDHVWGAHYSIEVEEQEPAAVALDA